MAKIRLKAVPAEGDAHHPRVGYRRTDGELVIGRFVGWKHIGKGEFEMLDDGEEIELTPANRTDYFRAVRRGELELLEGEF
jgi:hypothetical protein